MKVFLDTNVLLDMYWGRRNGIAFKLQLKSNKINCITSIDALYEFVNQLKEREFAVNQFLINKIELGQVFKQRSQKELTEQECNKIRLELENFLVDYDFVQVCNYDKTTWGLIKEVLVNSNIPSDDSRHLVTAIAHLCTHFVTRDSFLIKTGKDFCNKNNQTISVLYPEDLINQINIEKQKSLEITKKYFEELVSETDTYRSLGDYDAKVVMRVFADLECSFCQKFFIEVFPKIREEYIKTNKVRFTFIHFPLSFYPSSKIAAVAAEAAGRQNKFWDYVLLLYQNQAEWKENPTKLYDYAVSVGLDMALFDNFINDPKNATNLEEQVKQLSLVGVEGTPTFLINNITIVGSHPFEIYSTEIEKQLALGN